MIRPLQHHDYNQWYDLWIGYQTFYQVTLPLDCSKLTFSRLLDAQEPMACLVVELEGQLVAFVHYIFHRSTWTKGHYCYLQDLYVAESARSQGLGRQLIEAVYAKASEHQCSRVYWLTQEQNIHARQLYDQVATNAGFIQYRKNLNG